MRDSGRLRSCVAALLVSACGNRAAPAPWDYQQHVGVVIAIAQPPCLTIGGPSLAADTSVDAVDPQTSTVRRAIVVGPSESCARGGDSSALRSYALRFQGDSSTTPFIGIGVVGASQPIRVRNGAAAADLDGDRRDEFFRACTSQEGVHLTIWSDRPLDGVRRWHHYYSLGYDVSPTCTPAEVAAP